MNVVKPILFQGFDFSSFWESSDCCTKEFPEPPPAPLFIADIEAEFGFKLPVSSSTNGRTPAPP